MVHADALCAADAWTAEQLAVVREVEEAMEDLTVSNLAGGADARHPAAIDGLISRLRGVWPSRRVLDLRAERYDMTCAAAAAHHIHGKHEVAHRLVAVLTERVNRCATGD